MAFCLLAGASGIWAGGIQGTVYGEGQNPLPYASIYVKENGKGSSTNTNGYYELYLDPGTYHVVFQYLGYQTQVLTVTVGNSFKTLDVHLQPVAYKLSGYTVKATDEDPSYTIMRKAIAKAKYHLNQVDEYTAQVYIKGSGRLIDAPKFILKQMEEEGVDTSMALTMEILMNIEYERPSTYRQHVISQRISGRAEGIDPAEYVFDSFYEPEVTGLISPLSPKAFRYYKFLYVGSFLDQGRTINKIRIIPRTMGEGVVWGSIYLVEDEWSIYSVNIKTVFQGVNVNLKIDYGFIDDKVWLPVNHWLLVEGEYLGVEFEMKYIATVDQYKVKLNPDLINDFEVIDEKIDKQLAKEIEMAAKRDDLEGVDMLKKEKKVTRKELRKMMKEYEKMELKEKDAVDLLINSTVTVDSLAVNNDPAFWDSVRTVPLDTYEIKGYTVLDSIALAEEEKNDSTFKEDKKFFSDFGAFGWRLSENDRIYINYLLDYNSVDGFLIKLKPEYIHKTKTGNRFAVFGAAEYGFSRTTLYGYGGMSYAFGPMYKNGSVWIEGGLASSQYNRDTPVTPGENMLMAMFFERNIYKVYQKQYIEGGFRKWLWPKFGFYFRGTYEDRTSLNNTTTWSLINWKSREYTSNAPFNVEDTNTAFPNHRIVKADLRLTTYPWAKFSIRNGKKRTLRRGTPGLWLQVTGGKILNTENSDALDLLHIQVGIKHNWSMGANLTFSYNVSGGFLPMNNVYFPDFAHFAAKPTIFTAPETASHYRLLDSYEYSTREYYASVFADFEFRRFLLTQILVLRFAGIREHLFVNYLGTPNSKNFFEAGYTISNILSIFKIEGVASFNQEGYLDWGIRVGLTVDLKEAFRQRIF